MDINTKNLRELAFTELKSMHSFCDSIIKDSLTSLRTKSKAELSDYDNVAFYSNAKNELEYEMHKRVKSIFG